jgi:hypothetical protein
MVPSLVWIGNMKYEIKIDKTRDKLFDKLGLQRLKESYMSEGEESPQERFAFVSSESIFPGDPFPSGTPFPRFQSTSLERPASRGEKRPLPT